jgi:hypothetical protein
VIQTHVSSISYVFRRIASATLKYFKSKLGRTGQNRVGSSGTWTAGAGERETRGDSEGQASGINRKAVKIVYLKSNWGLFG